MTYIFLCENSLEGIFTGVYEAWASGYGHKNIQLSNNQSGNIILFSEIIPVKPDFEKSQKVSETLLRRFGQEFHETICSAALADERAKKLPMEKSNAIYQTIVMAFAYPTDSRILDYIQEPCIHCVFQLHRQLQREAHHYLGFLRFRELSGSKILYSSFHPVHNILSITAEHFVDRFPMEHFIIHDETYHQAAVHQAGHSYLIADDSLLQTEALGSTSPEEAQMQSLWCTFFETIAIKERIKPKLQRQNIPKRYWPDTVELANRLP